ncbi:hypothetical protein H5410_015238 [Solanum commersonii]|uniref:Uncharacterized protein n=1 Tax=Solanum commersonii TaxID=4109 RepID=A0A9J5ZT51_SOLCO|nr:hypothetical protein H5410_015238 [Solanum commersonii]
MVTVNIGMLHYVLDHVYGAFVHRTKLSPPFFSRGWGESHIARVAFLAPKYTPPHKTACVVHLAVLHGLGHAPSIQLCNRKESVSPISCGDHSECTN